MSSEPTTKPMRKARTRAPRSRRSTSASASTRCGREHRLVEAKRHKNPIKRELVQVLHAKLRSVGAQKAVMIATSPYQRGALEYAKTHGMALVTVTEGRFTFETKAKDKPPAMSREGAAARYDLPTFVGQAYQPGDAPASISVTLLSVEYPEYVLEAILGATNREPGL